jgi:hypothetical protein
MRLTVASALFVWLCISNMGTAFAHKPSDAFMRVDFDNKISLQLSVALKDLDVVIENLDENQDRHLTYAEFKAATAEINALVQKEVGAFCGAKPLNLQWRTDDSAESSALEKRNDGAYVRLKAELTCDVSQAIQLQYRLFEDIDTSHRLLITNTLNSVEALQVGAPSEKLWLIRGAPSLAESSSQSSFKSSSMATLLTFVIEGFVHLAKGWDHLAFILVLVLPFTLWKISSLTMELDWLNLKKLLFVISAFTVGHCLTLVLVTLDIVNVTGQWVEPAIALTVVLSAALNLMPDLKVSRTYLPLVFGTIHGLGFSSVLSELEISAGSRLMALIGFNLGIEFGQVAFVAIWLLAQFWLIKWAGYQRWVLVGGSTLLMLSATFLVIVRAAS